MATESEKYENLWRDLHAAQSRVLKLELELAESKREAESLRRQNWIDRKATSAANAKLKSVRSMLYKSRKSEKTAIEEATRAESRATLALDNLVLFKTAIVND